MQTKTDNAQPSGKLELRRYFLRRFHAAGEIRVLDCCQATGFLWRALGHEFPLASSWGVDINPKPGRLRIDSAKILGQPGWQQNVVDIDTYGSPWTHWLALLAHAPAHPITVFLTVGMVVNRGGSTLPKPIVRALGLHHFQRLSVPRSLTPRLMARGVETMLGAALAAGYHIHEAREAPPGRRARYLGLHLEKIDGATPEAADLMQSARSSESDTLLQHIHPA